MTYLLFDTVAKEIAKVSALELSDKAKSMRNGPDRAENSQRFKAFSATGETVFELFCYIYERLEQPPTSEMGDVAFPCFTLAKIMKKPPHIIAEGIRSQLCEQAISPVFAEIKSAADISIFIWTKPRCCGSSMKRCKRVRYWIFHISGAKKSQLSTPASTPMRRPT